MSGSCHIAVAEDEGAVSNKLCDFIVSEANNAIKERDVFTVGLSGGSLTKFLSSGLPKLTTDWSKWKVFFCDERHVPFDNAECTYNIYKEKLMTQVPLEECNVYPNNPEVSVEGAALEYTDKLKSVFGEETWPRFDLLLLGMGPDGHTCSLFPGHPLLEEQTAWVAPISDSPKPPPQRITFTLPLIRNARCVAFASCGAGKAEMVKRVLEGNETPLLPAARVQPHSGSLWWFLDKPAARLLEAHTT